MVKNYRFFAFILLISLIFTISPVMAQDPDPPDEEHIESRSDAPLDIAAMEALGIDFDFDTASQGPTWETPPADTEDRRGGSANNLTNEEPQQPLNSAAEFEAPPEPISPEVPFAGNDESLSMEANDPESPQGISDRVVYPDTSYIGIATSDTLNEITPAIAHGDGYYMVVYLVNGDIRAKVYDHNGRYYISGTVYNHVTYDCSEPSIAYESQTGLFIVTFQMWNSTTMDYDVLGIAVSVQTGPMWPVYGIGSIDGTDEEKPSVACNAQTGNCLVAYEYDNGNQPVRGKFLYINSSGISSVGSLRLLGYYDGLNPHLAWGRNTGTYLLLYEYFYSLDFEWVPMYNHLHDAYVLGNQYLYTGYFLVNPTWDIRNGFDILPLGATYDPCTQRYLVLFSHEVITSIDHDIYFTFLKKTEYGTHGQWPIADTPDDEYTGDIHFVTDDHAPLICNLTDQIVVTYKNAQDGVYATNIWGNSNPTSPSFAWNADESVHLLVAMDFSTLLDAYDPVIASGDHGRMFIAWEYQSSSPFDEDIFGSLIRVYWTNFIPMLQK